MKKTVFAIAICVFAAACHPKTIPQTEKNAAKSDAPAKTNSERDLSVIEGEKLYQSSCGKCHDLKDPSKYTASEWKPIMESMAPKARLTMEQKIDVMTYVTSKAKSLK
jgi:cytochrome c5